MTEFNAVVESWHDFFDLAGNASATLLGLLFVGISFRTDIRKQPPDSFMRSVVTLNFLHYLIVILFALFFQIPGISPDELAWSIIITALVAFATVLRATIRLRPQLANDRETTFWHLLVPLLCYLGAAGVGVAIMVHDDDAISWMVTVNAFLLIIPTRNAWELVMSSTETG